MRSTRGQALVELAVSSPVLVLLALGVAGVVQIEDAAAGLDAATHAAAGAAARAPDPAAAGAAAHARFDAVAAGYQLRAASIDISYGTFTRSTEIVATSTAFVDVGWAGLVLPHRFALRSRAVTRIELWRTHRSVT
jgi:Flp pilus assembly protein TadG